MARIRLGDLMIRAGLIDEMQLQSALSVQKQWGGKLGDVLVNNGFLDEMMLYRGLSKQLAVPLVSLPTENIPRGIEATIPIDLCQKHSVFPLLRDDKGLTIATSDPNNVGGIDEIAFRVGTRLRIVLAPDREIEWAIRRYYQGDPSPCPPPKARRITGDLPAPTAAPAAVPSMAPGPALGQPNQTSAAELAAIAAQALQSAQTAQQATQSSAWWNQRAVSEAEVAVRETASLLRFLVEASVQRGIFTREQYLAKLKSL